MSSLGIQHRAAFGARAGSQSRIEERARDVFGDGAVACRFRSLGGEGGRGLEKLNRGLGRLDDVFRAALRPCQIAGGELGHEQKSIILDQIGVRHG